VIEGRDEEVFVPGLRARFRLDEGKGPEADAADGSGHFLEVAVLGGSGEDSQRIDATQTIEFGGESFSGPADVSSGFDLSIGHVAWARRIAAERWLALTGLAGLGFARSDVELASGAVRASEDDFAVNAVLGGGLAVPLSRRFEIAFDLEGTLVPIDDVQFWSAELGVRVRATDHLGFFGGWRTIHYERVRSGSDLDLEASGPALALELAF